MLALNATAGASVVAGFSSLPVSRDCVYSPVPLHNGRDECASTSSDTVSTHTRQGPDGATSLHKKRRRNTSSGKPDRRRTQRRSTPAQAATTSNTLTIPVLGPSPSTLTQLAPTKVGAVAVFVNADGQVNPTAPVASPSLRPVGVRRSMTAVPAQSTDFVDDLDMTKVAAFWHGTLASAPATATAAVRSVTPVMSDAPLPPPAVITPALVEAAIDGALVANVYAGVDATDYGYPPHCTPLPHHLQHPLDPTPARSECTASMAAVQ